MPEIDKPDSELKTHRTMVTMTPSMRNLLGEIAEILECSIAEVVRRGVDLMAKQVGR